MKLQRNRSAFRILGSILATILLSSLLTTGTVLAQENDKDEPEPSASHSRTQGTWSHRSWRDTAHRGGNPLYRIGDEFGLTPEEVDKFLFLVKALGTRMADTKGMNYPTEYLQKNRSELITRGKMDRKGEFPSRPGAGRSYSGKPELREVVIIKRFYVDGMDDWMALKADYMADDVDGHPFGRQHPGSMKRMKNGVGSTDVGTSLDHSELTAKMALVLQDPAIVQSLLPMAELFWPRVSDMVETMTGMPLEDLVQDEVMLGHLVSTAGPMLAVALEQGLVSEDLILQFLTMLE